MLAPEKLETLDDIWRDDLLGRRGDAVRLSEFVESLQSNFASREDMKAFTIALDADYGIGKTYFLRRFARQLSASHPVAYVDAWADDIIDEPLTALAATLIEALEPIAKEAGVKPAISRVLSASGEVLRIGTVGFAKRALGLVIGAGAAEAVEHVLGQANDAAADVLGGAVIDAVGAVGDVVAKTKPNKLMLDRVAEFRAGKAASDSLRESLRGLVSSIEKGGLKLPIVIIIDELDRCRPTYAIKLLEEIKNLFDVEGLVFILGMNLDQLSHSVKGAYGAGFDGSAYLRKFIWRRYRLSAPDLTQFFELLLRQSPMLEAKLFFPSVRIDGRPRELTTAQILARYMDAYKLSIRDAYQVFDRLSICCALTQKIHLIMPYLLPLLISEVKHRPRGTLPELEKALSFTFDHQWWDETGQRDEQFSLDVLAASMAEAANHPRSEITRRINNYRLSLAEETIFNARDIAERARVPLADPSKYLELLDAVGKFELVSED